jgi:predicted Mrr-cat superfamily restriction endonuclease
LFGPEPDDLPYVWPEADDVPPAPAPQGVEVWVVRPRVHGELGACLAAGVIGLGTQSGIDVDATGLFPEELRVLSKELSGRRPAKDLRQLSAFLDEMQPGSRVALPIEHGAGLLLGKVVGDYLFQGRELLPHRRPARWDRVVPRSAALPPATLQDPRALFRVTLDPSAVA